MTSQWQSERAGFGIVPISRRRDGGSYLYGRGRLRQGLLSGHWISFVRTLEGRRQGKLKMLLCVRLATIEHMLCSRKDKVVNPVLRVARVGAIYPGVVYI